MREAAAPPHWAMELFSKNTVMKTMSPAAASAPMGDRMASGRSRRPFPCRPWTATLCPARASGLLKVWTRSQAVQEAEEVEPISTLEELVQRAKRGSRAGRRGDQARRLDPRATRTDARQRDDDAPPAPRAQRRPLRSSSLAVTDALPAGHQAAELCAMLRARQHADLSFCGLRALLKTLRLLALANLFLASHKSSCAFVFQDITPEQHQARLQQLIVRQDSTQREQARRNGSQAWRHRPTPAQSGSGALSQSPQPPSGGPEPPCQPLAFTLHVWQSKASTVRVQSADVQFFDFALDLRQDWARVAYVSFDTALSLSDNLHAQLTAQAAALQAEPQRPGDAPVPELVCAADKMQSLVVLLALSCLQQRLADEGSGHALVCCVLPDAALPRADGRKGFVFKLKLQPAELVQALLARQSTPRKKLYSQEGQPQPAPPARVPAQG